MGYPRISLSDLPHLIREYLEALPLRVRAWRDRVRQDPSALWRSPAVRIALWIILGVLTYFAVATLIRMLTPGPARGDTHEVATPTALLRVACTRTSCLHAATIERPRSFRDWPVRCDACGSEAMYRARACPECRRWFATAPGAPDACPHCAARKQAVPVRPASEAAPTSSDDEEDGWGR